MKVESSDHYQDRLNLVSCYQKMQDFGCQAVMNPGSATKRQRDL
jgi:hypothetical protein